MLHGRCSCAISTVQNPKHQFRGFSIHYSIFSYSGFTSEYLGIVRVNGEHKYYQSTAGCECSIFAIWGSSLVYVSHVQMTTHENPVYWLSDGWLCFPYSKLQSSGQVILSTMCLVWPLCLTKPHVFHVPNREQADTQGLI